MVQLVIEGQPLTLRLTVPLNPFSGVTVMVYVAVEPGPTDSLEGEVDTEKSGVVLPQEVNLKLPMRVCQLRLPLVGMYSFVYQKVQSSDGSTLMLL